MPAAHTRTLVPWLLLAVIALIGYGSLYPFNFKPDAIEGGVLEALRQLSWARAGRGDRIANVLLYLPLGFCLFLWLEVYFQRVASVVLGTLAGAALSLIVEVAQVYVSIRVPSLTDLTLNALGTAIGAAAGLAWEGLSRLMHLPTRTERPVRDPGAALLIGLWLGWRLAPFAPQLDLAKLKAALRPLTNPQFEPASVFVYLACWLVVNQAVAALASRPRRLEVLLLLIAIVLAGRLLVAGQAFVPDELLALLLLLPMVVLMHRLTPRPRRAVLVLVIAAVLIIAGLGPFDFIATSPRFDLWPFLAWINQGLPVDWEELFGKLFLFGAFTWVIKEWSASLRVAIVAVTTTVLGIELLQMWLPGQGASVTDPVLALLLGLAFHSLYRRFRPRELQLRRAFGRGG